MTERIVNAAGGLVKNTRGEILMIFRLGRWDLPKGKLEENEKIEECAVREVSEETGLPEDMILPGELICMTIHHYEMFGEKIEKHTYWYKMDFTGDTGITPVPQTEEDIVSALWVPENEITEKLTNTYDTIREVFRKGM